MNNLALIYYSLLKHSEAQPLFEQALAIKKKALGAEHLEVAHILTYLATLYHLQRKYSEAAAFYEQALAIRKKNPIYLKNTSTAGSLSDLAGVYVKLGKFSEAEPLYKQAVEIMTKVLGDEDTSVAMLLEKYADLLKNCSLAKNGPKYEW